MPIKLKGKVYVACVRSMMVYGSETWPVKVEDVKRLERAEMRMVRWMSGVSLRERVKKEDLRGMLGIENVSDVMTRGRLQWLGHVSRKGDDDGVKKCMEVEGVMSRGRPNTTWSDVVERDMRERGMKREDAQDREKWRQLSWTEVANPRGHGDKGAIKRL